MENTDAKVFLMIDDLSLNAIGDLLGDDQPYATGLANMRRALRFAYERGDVPAEEIIAAWNDDTWNGKE